MATRERSTKTVTKPQERGPEFSREMALVWLDGLDEQFNNIASVVIGGLAHNAARAEEHKDPVLCGLLRVIQRQADDSTQISGELRTLLEKLPEDLSNGESDKEESSNG
jgi:hypothetical protein